MDEEAVTGAVAAFAAAPGRAGQFRAVEVTGGPEASADAIGQVLAVGVGDGRQDGTYGAAVARIAGEDPDLADQ